MVSSAGAATLVVDSNFVESNNYNEMGILGTIIVYPSIQAAINAASDGDTISIMPGTYRENQLVINKAITVEGSGSSTTIIDGSTATLSTDPGLIRITATSGDVTFSGFTVQNARANPAHAGNSGIPVRINNLKAYRWGIGFWNNAPGSGSPGNINAPFVLGNTIKGISGSNTASIGIRLLGLVTDANISHNIIDTVDVSFRGQEWNSHIATGTILKYNNFSNSTTGLDWQGASILDATYNWWGSDSGPGPVGPGSEDRVSANVSYDPWLPDTAPASVTNLVNVSYASNYINWTWADPANIDFNGVKIYLDGIYTDIVVAKGVQHYNATVFPGTNTIGTITIDVKGNENATMVTNTSTTLLPEIRFMKGTVFETGTTNGIPVVTVSNNSLPPATTNDTGFYSLAVGSGDFILSATLDPAFYPDSSIPVSTIGEAVMLKDIALDKKPTGNITGSVTIG